MATLSYVAGTLELRGVDPETCSLPASCVWDKRARTLRAPALAYADMVRALVRAEVAFEDQARQYSELESGLRAQREPRPFQSEALRPGFASGAAASSCCRPGPARATSRCWRSRDAAQHAGRRADARPGAAVVRSAAHELCARTWASSAAASTTVRPLTVTTYDSAYLHMEHLGARFGLVVFDECHHLPGETLRAGRAAVPGALPARAHRDAGAERTVAKRVLDELVGPSCTARTSSSSRASYLADYETVRIDDRARRRTSAASTRASAPSTSPSCARRASRMGSAARLGRVHDALCAQRRRAARHARLPPAARAGLRRAGKLEYVEQLLSRITATTDALVFTQDNATAYGISRRFLVPAITHQTKVSRAQRDPRALLRR